MKRNRKKTKEQLTHELADLLQRISELEALETKPKRTVKVLSEFEEMYRSVFNKSRDGIALIDKETGYINDCNPEFERQAGRNLEQLKKMAIWELRPPEEVEVAKKMFFEIREKGAGGSAELSFQKPNGEVVPIDFLTTVLTIGDKQYLLSMTRDITERKQAEEALREKERRFSDIADNAMEWIWEVDANGKYIYSSPVVEEILGYKPEELLTKHFYDLFLPNDREELKKAAFEVFAQKQPFNEFINQNVHKNGKIVWLSTSGVPIIDEKGNLRGYRGADTDITKHKQAEKELREAELKYRIVADNTYDWEWWLSPAGEFIYTSPSCSRITGYSASEFMDNAKLLWNIIHPDDMPVWENHRGLTNQGKVAPALEFRILHKDGSKRWIEHISQPVFDDTGKFQGSRGSNRDITERKRSQSMLEARLRLLQLADKSSVQELLQATLDELETLTDSQIGFYHFVEEDQQTLSLQNWSTRTLREFCTAELRERHYKISEAGVWVDCIHQRRPVIHNDYAALPHRKGMPSWHALVVRELVVPVFRSDRIVAVLGMGNKPQNYTKQDVQTVLDLADLVWDIVARKRAEEIINHLNLTLRSIRNVNQLITRERDRNKLIQGVCDALVAGGSFYTAWIMLLDKSKNPTTWASVNAESGFATLIESMKRSEYPYCVQKALKQKDAVIVEDPYTMCLGCPMIRGGRKTGSIIIRLEIQGTIYGILYTSLPRELLTSKEEVSLFREVATDITSALYNMELGAMNKLLEQERLRTAKLESIGTLAGGIAHDFNNLLTGIMGNIGLAKRHLEPGGRAFERLDEAEKAFVRARDLTQQLLTFARGGAPVKKLATITEVIKESATFALRGSNVKHKASLPHDIWPVEIDEGQINQVIHNIVKNADEAMPSGGTLHISVQNMVIERPGMLPLPKGNYVRVDLEDEGIGISQKQLERIFEPYYTTKQKGSGLGLSTAYSIIKNHGGYITVESKQNTGTTFHVYLPASKKPLPTRGEVKREMSITGKGKILVMDDEEIIREMLNKMLPLAGYEVELTSDGAEAIERYVKATKVGKPFDAVIMDLTIPGGIGGKEAVKKLLEIDPNAKVIVSSGYSTDPIMSEYKEYGFSAVITKPYSVGQIEHTLRDILKGEK